MTIFWHIEIIFSLKLVIPIKKSTHSDKENYPKSVLWLYFKDQLTYVC